MKIKKIGLSVLMATIIILLLASCDIKEDETIVLSNKSFKQVKENTSDKKNSSYNDEKEACQIIAVGSDNWYPYQLRDENGEAYGAGYEILKEILQPLGMKVQLGESKPFKRLLTELEDGTTDVFVGLYFNEERKKKYNYTKEFAVDEVKIFVSKERTFEFNGFEDLKGKLGIINKGASYGNEFEAAKEYLTLKEVNDVKQQYEMLMNGQVDYYISAYHNAMQNLKKEGFKGKIIPLPKNVKENKVHFLVSKNSPLSDMIPQINEKLDKMKEDGVLDEIINKYD